MTFGFFLIFFRQNLISHVAVYEGVYEGCVSWAGNKTTIPPASTTCIRKQPGGVVMAAMSATVVLYTGIRGHTKQQQQHGSVRMRMKKMMMMRGYCMRV